MVSYLDIAEEGLVLPRNKFVQFPGNPKLRSDSGLSKSRGSITE